MTGRSSLVGSAQERLGSYRRGHCSKGLGLENALVNDDQDYSRILWFLGDLLARDEIFD